MKIASTFAATTLLLLSGYAMAANPAGCVAEYDATVDYFPDKSEVTLAEQYTIEYGLNYKILQVPASSATYLLVQCGTPVPAALNASDFTDVISIPLTTYGMDTSTYVPFMELLGLRYLQVAHKGQADFFAGACYKELIDAGDIVLVDTIANETYIDQKGIPKDTPWFVGPFGGSGSVFAHNIIVYEYIDRSNLAVFEWIKYFGAFFNREVEANTAFEDSKDRYECATDNADLIKAGLNETKTVVWASYSNFPGFEGFYAANACPNYYCELAEICGVELLIQGGAMNITEFLDFAMGADIWMYSGTNVQTTLDLFPELQGLKAVQNNEIYDILGHGEDAWFNDRKVEPAALLEDFCHIVGTENPSFPHDPAFIRHIDNPEKTVAECTSQCDPYAHFGDFCQPITTDGSTPPPADTPDLPENCASPTSAPSAMPTSAAPMTGFAAAASVLTILATVMV